VRIEREQLPRQQLMINVKGRIAMNSRFASCLLAMGLVVGLSTVCAAADYYFRDPGLLEPPPPAGLDGNWFTETDGDPNADGGTNWWDRNGQVSYIPDYTYDDKAFIENGGTAFVNTNGAFSPGQIVLGSAGGTSGTLEIQSGGVLSSTQGAATNGNITVGSSGGVGTLRVLPGGVLTSATSIVEGSNSNNLIQVGNLAGAGMATLSGSTATLSSKVQVFPNAAFSTTGAGNLLSSATYTSEITGNGASGKIDIGATASIGGNLVLNFNSYVPSVGHNWTVLEAASYSGDFSSITSNATLASNQNFVVSKPAVGGGQTGYNVSLQEVLVLEVNRNTGMATITHPGSSSISLDGYFVGSDVGGLDPSGRSSVNGQSSLGNDWVDTAATPNNVGELKISSNGSIAGGNVASISLGSIFDATAGPFGQNNEDLEFGYRRADGNKFPGRVHYVGDKYNTLVLYVDPTGTGDAILRNASDKTAIIDGYEILSDASRLTSSGWNSLHEQEYEGADTWLELDNNANQLGEVNQIGFTSLAPNATLNLGPLYLGGAQDLELNFLLQDDELGVGTNGKVFYESFTPIVVAGDYNGDGTVNAADYTVWRNTLGSTTDLRANGDNTGGSMNKIDEADYAFWKSHFGNTMGSGSAAVGGNQSVPEPATGLLLTLALGFAVAIRKRDA
jgi:hypothetical protein